MRSVSARWDFFSESVASSDEWLNHCSSSWDFSTSSFLRVSSRYFSSTTSSLVSWSSSVASCFQAWGCSATVGGWRLRAVMGMSIPAANSTSAPSGGTSRRGHCHASPASMPAIGAGHGETPALAAESEFLKRMAASILTSDWPGSSNLREAHALQPSASAAMIPPTVVANIQGSMFGKQRLTTSSATAPLTAAASRRGEKVSSHQAKFTWRDTRLAVASQ